jgi:undecaprenyl-diphosphatase
VLSGIVDHCEKLAILFLFKLRLLGSVWATHFAVNGLFQTGDFRGCRILQIAASKTHRRAASEKSQTRNNCLKIDRSSIWHSNCLTMVSFNPGTSKMPNSLDFQISRFFAEFNGTAPQFDIAVWALSANSLLKGGVLVAFLLLAWFDGVDANGVPGRQTMVSRAKILAVLISASIGEVIARILAKTLEFRPRPLLDHALPFRLPNDVTIETLGIAGESSFPSDHAVMFFALATGVWLISRRAGLFSYLWVTLAIIFPRLYLGLHYFSDLFVGGLLGVVCTVACVSWLGKSKLLEMVADLSQKRPALIYPAFFLGAHQIANMLSDVRAMAQLFAT